MYDSFGTWMVSPPKDKRPKTKEQRRRKQRTAVTDPPTLMIDMSSGDQYNWRNWDILACVNQGLQIVINYERTYSQAQHSVLTWLSWMPRCKMDGKDYPSFLWWFQRQRAKLSTWAKQRVEWILGFWACKHRINAGVQYQRCSWAKQRKTWPQSHR